MTSLSITESMPMLFELYATHSQIRSWIAYNPFTQTVKRQSTFFSFLRAVLYPIHILPTCTFVYRKKLDTVALDLSPLVSLALLLQVPSPTGRNGTKRLSESLLSF